MRFSLWNPIRFVETTDTYNTYVDWMNIFPNGDNLLSKQTKFHGSNPPVYTPKFTQDTLKGQFQSETLYSPGDVTIIAIDKNQNVLNIDFSITNVTPSVWYSGGSYESYIYEYDITLLDEITTAIQLKFSDDVGFWISEPLEILYVLKNHIRIEYGNSENDYGMIFDKDGTPYKYTIFLDAKMIPAPKNKKSVYEDVRGLTQIMRSTPKREWEVLIPYIPGYIYEKINFIFSCNIILMNGVSIVSEEGISPEQLAPYYDGFSGKIIVSQNTWDYRENQIIVPEVVLIDSTPEALIDDEDEGVSN